MLEIRLHGRGGQGVVTGAELIAISAFYNGKFSQAFPYFGVERRGAPIEAYARIDEKFINLREQIKEPDIVIIQDASLVTPENNILHGLKNKGIIIINTSKNLNDLFKPVGKIEKTKLKAGKRLPAFHMADEGFILISNNEKKKFRVMPVDGTTIALKILGKPIVNTLLTFELAKSTGIISPETVEKALKDKFTGEILKKNLMLQAEL